jgi:signal transduction histidine kinase
VVIALKSIVSNLSDFQNTGIPKELQRTNFSDRDTIPVFLRIKPAKIDSIVKKRMAELKVEEQYAYGIYDDEDSLFVAGRYQGYEKQLQSTKYRVEMSCLEGADKYWMAVCFFNRKKILFGDMIGWTILSAVFILILISSFYLTVTLMFRQKKLSDMKTDFVNNLTHEFKTPMATISLSSEMLLQEKVRANPEKVEWYARIIQNENKRLKKQVEQILQMAILEKKSLVIKKKIINLHEIIKEQIPVAEIPLKQKNGTLTAHLKAEKSNIYGDKGYLENIISNLLDNAVKYSPYKPQIEIDTYNKNNGIVVSITDNGIGISHEHQKYVFDNFYRVPTGNIHDVKGFGIGLYYVKTMVEAHGGTIKLESEPNKGSRFEIFFPTKKSNI